MLFQRPQSEGPGFGQTKNSFVLMVSVMVSEAITAVLVGVTYELQGKGQCPDMWADGSPPEKISQADSFMQEVGCMGKQEVP